MVIKVETVEDVFAWPPGVAAGDFFAKGGSSPGCAEFVTDVTSHCVF